MRMKSRLLLLSVTVVLLFVSCKKEKSLEGSFKGNTCDYAPYSTGSSFAYQQVIVSLPDTFSFTLLAKQDTALGGELYRVLEDEMTGGVSLFRCGGGDYIQLADISELPGAPTEPVKTTYLKDNVNLGQGWEEQIPVTLPVIGDVVLTVNYTVMQKGTNKTVLGTTYEDVIGVRMEVSAPPFLPPTELSTNYYAKGVGLIQLDTEEDTTRLSAYTIR